MDTTHLPKTRAEAKATGATHYFTGEPCKHGHIAPRKTKGACIECLKVEWQNAAETRADYFREYNQREDIKDRKNEWYQENREAVIAAAATRPAAVLREYRNAWKANNKTQVRADTKARRRKHRDRELPTRPLKTVLPKAARSASRPAAMAASTVFASLRITGSVKNGPCCAATAR